MPASILQINISRGGVPKLAVPSAVVTLLGIEGDLHAHPEVHGGPSKALLLITLEGTAELVGGGFPLYAGALGENITTVGLDRHAMRPGQQYRIGGMVVELAKLRSPCRTIQVYGADIGKAVYDDQVKDGDPTSPRWGLGGFYARVVTPGSIRTGDPIELMSAPECSAG